LATLLHDLIPTCKTLDELFEVVGNQSNRLRIRNMYHSYRKRGRQYINATNQKEPMTGITAGTIFFSQMRKTTFPTKARRKDPSI